MSEEQKLENMELDDQIFEDVVGGRYKEGVTKLECINRSCRRSFRRSGNYMNEEWYKCPSCDEKTLHGVRYAKTVQELCD